MGEGWVAALCGLVNYFMEQLKEQKDVIEEEEISLKKLLMPRLRRLCYYLIPLLVMAGFILWLRYSQERHISEMMTRQQIWQIRNALLVYYVLFESKPPDLETLAHTKFIEPTTGKEIMFMDGVKFDKKGRMIDPLGYPYIYDIEKGMIYSTAPCCKDW